MQPSIGFTWIYTLRSANGTLMVLLMLLIAIGDRADGRAPAPGLPIKCVGNGGGKLKGRSSENGN